MGNDRRAEDEEGHRTRGTPDGLGQLRAPLLTCRSDRAERQSSDKRRDQPAPVEDRGEAVGQADESQRHDRSPSSGTQPRATPRAAPAPQAAGKESSDHPEADLLDDEPERLSLPAALGRREGERDEQQRHAQAVVQPALDVEALADAQRHPLVGDHRGPEGRIGRRHGDRQEDGLDGREPRQDDQRDGGADRDRQRKSDAEQARRESDLLRNLRRSIFEASAKSTSASVASAMSRSAAPLP